MPESTRYPTTYFPGDGGSSQYPETYFPDEEYGYAPVAPDPVPPPTPIEDEGVTLADYGRVAMADIYSTGKGLGWFLRTVGVERLGKVIEEAGAEGVDAWHDNLTPDAQRSMAKEFISTNEDGSWEWGDPDLHTAGLLAFGSLPTTLAMLASGGAVAKGLQLLANPFGRAALKQAVDIQKGFGIVGKTKASKKLRLIDTTIGMVSFGAAEGLIEGSMVGAQTYERMMTMDPEVMWNNDRFQQVYQSTDEDMDPLERFQYASHTVGMEAAKQAAYRTTGTTGALGAPLGYLLGPVVGRTGRFAASRLAGAGKGSAIEAGQELAQSGFARVWQNAALKEYDTDITTFEGVANEMVAGFVAGGILGAGFGALNPNVNQPTSASQYDRIMEVAGNTSLAEQSRKAAAAGAPQAVIISVLKKVGTLEITPEEATKQLSDLEKEGPKIEEQWQQQQAEAAEEAEAPAAAPTEETEAPVVEPTVEVEKVDELVAGTRESLVQKAKDLGIKVKRKDTKPIIAEKIAKEQLARQAEAGEEPAVAPVEAETTEAPVEAEEAKLARFVALARIYELGSSGENVAQSKLPRLQDKELRELAATAGVDVAGISVDTAIAEKMFKAAYEYMRAPIPEEDAVEVPEPKAAPVEAEEAKDAVIPENVKEGDRIGVFDAAGVPYTATVTAVSEAGTVRILNQEGNDVILNQDLSATTTNVRNPAYKLESKGLAITNITGRASAGLDVLGDSQLAELESVLKERVATYPIEQGAGMAAVSDLNAVRLRIKERQEQQAKPVAKPKKAKAKKAKAKKKAKKIFESPDEFMMTEAEAAEAEAMKPPVLPKVKRHRQTLHRKIDPQFNEMEELKSALGIDPGSPIPPIYFSRKIDQREGYSLKSFDAIQKHWVELGIFPPGEATRPDEMRFEEIGELLERNDPIPTDPNYNKYLESLGETEEYERLQDALKARREGVAEEVEPIKPLKKATMKSINDYLSSRIAEARRTAPGLDIGGLSIVRVKDEETGERWFGFESEDYGADVPDRVEFYDESTLDQGNVTKFIQLSVEEWQTELDTALDYYLEGYHEQAAVEKAFAEDEKEAALGEKPKRGPQEPEFSRRGGALDPEVEVIRPGPGGTVLTVSVTNAQARLMYELGSDWAKDTGQLPPAASSAGDLNPVQIAFAEEGKKQVEGRTRIQLTLDDAVSEVPPITAEERAIPDEGILEGDFSLDSFFYYVQHYIDRMPDTRGALPSGLGRTLDVIEQYNMENKGLAEVAAPEPERGLTRFAFDQIVKVATSKVQGIVNVNVVDRASDIPSTDAVPSDVGGAYLSGTNLVYIVREDINTSEELKKVLAHEVFGHFAMEQIPEFNQVLKTIMKLRGSDNKIINDIADIVLSKDSKISDKKLSKEILAYMVENNVRTPLVARGRAAARAFLRRIGIQVKMTEADEIAWIDSMIVKGARELNQRGNAFRTQLEAGYDTSSLSDPAAASSEIIKALDRMYADSSHLLDMRLWLEDQIAGIETDKRWKGKRMPPDVKDRLNNLRRSLEVNKTAPSLFSKAFHGFEEGESQTAGPDVPEIGESINLPSEYLWPTVRKYTDRIRADEQAMFYLQEYLDNQAGSESENVSFEAFKQRLEDIASDIPEISNSGEFAFVFDLQIKSIIADASNKGKPHTSITDVMDSFIEKYGTQKDGQFEPLFQRRGEGAAGSRRRSVLEDILDRRVAKSEEDLSLKDRFRNWYAHLFDFNLLAIKQGLIDSTASLEKLEIEQYGRILDASVSPWKGVLATRNIHGVIATVMAAGVPVMEGGAFVRKSGRKGFLEIFSPLADHKEGNLLRLWEGYAVAKRANVLLKQKNKDGTEREKWIPQEEVDLLLELGDVAKHPEYATEDGKSVFEEVHKEWITFNNQVLELSVQTAVNGADDVAKWMENDWVSFHRALEEVEFGDKRLLRTQPGGKGKGKGVAGVTSGILRLKGAEIKIAPVFQNMIMNTTHLIDASFRNEAMRRVVLSYEGVALHRLDSPVQPFMFRDDQLANALRKGGLIVGNAASEVDEQSHAVGVVGRMTKDQKEHWSTLFRKVAPVGDDVVTMLEPFEEEYTDENGETKTRKSVRRAYFSVDDPLLLRTLEGVGSQNYEHIWGLLTGSKRLLTTMVTADPAFMMANMARDTVIAWAQTDVGLIPLVDAVKGAKAAFLEDEDMLAISMAGASGGGYYDTNSKNIRTLLARKMPEKDVGKFMNTIVTPKKMWRFWRKVGFASEQANRVAVFRRVIKNGGTLAEAAYQARDVLNFTMSGDNALVQSLIQTVPFMNARIQGVYRLYRGQRDHPRSFYPKVLTLAGLSLGLLAKNWDNDDYQALPEWDKDLYWHFWIGRNMEEGERGEHFRFPKPFEVGQIFATLPERLWRWKEGEDDFNLLRERGLAIFLDTFAMNPIPQLFKPVFEQVANRDFFTNSPVVGLTEAGLPEEQQYTAWTSETMRTMANAMPDWAPGWLRSPRRLEHALRGYFGATGMYLLSMADQATTSVFDYPERPTTDVRDRPVLSRFWRNQTPRYTKYSDNLYDMLEEADSIYRGYNAFKRQKLYEEAKDLISGDNKSKLIVRKHLNKIVARVRKINAKIRAIESHPTMSGERKAEKLDSLRQQKNKIISKVAPFAEFF